MAGAAEEPKNYGEGCESTLPELRDNVPRPRLRERDRAPTDPLTF